MSGVDSSVILVNLTNDTKIANKAIVTGISSSGTQSLVRECASYDYACK